MISSMLAYFAQQHLIRKRSALSQPFVCESTMSLLFYFAGQNHFFGDRGQASCDSRTTCSPFRQRTKSGWLFSTTSIPRNRSRTVSCSNLANVAHGRGDVLRGGGNLAYPRQDERRERGGCCGEWNGTGGGGEGKGEMGVVIRIFVQGTW